MYIWLPQQQHPANNKQIKTSNNRNQAAKKTQVSTKQVAGWVKIFISNVT
jgi:hypothetical protein